MLCLCLCSDRELKEAGEAPSSLWIPSRGEELEDSEVELAEGEEGQAEDAASASSFSPLASFKAVHLPNAKPMFILVLVLSLSRSLCAKKCGLFDLTGTV